MRESLTFLAILLIVVLTTALVGPYLVDWNQHRGQIEARLSDLLDAKVRIAGPVDLKLLPRPIFRLQSVTAIADAPRGGRLSADRLDVELSLTALLHGELLFVEAEITRPTLTLTTDNGGVVLPGFGGSNPERVSLDHLAVHDGTLVLLDGASARTISGLNGDGEADSLAGPFRFNGRLDTARGPLGFRLVTGAYEAQKVRLKASLDPVAGTPRTDLEGTLRLGEASGGASKLSFEGSVTAAGQMDLTRGTSLPWRITSHLAAAPDQAELTDLELRAGPDGRALVATGTGRIAPLRDGSAQLSLKAPQLDVGKLVKFQGDPDDPSVSPGDVAAIRSRLHDTLAALQAFVLDDAAAMPFPGRLDVDYAIDTVSLGTQTLTNLAGRNRLQAGKPTLGTVSIEAPDGTRLALDGSFEAGPAAVFKGKIRAETRDLPHLAAGLAGDFPEAAAWASRTIPARSFAVSGAIDLSGIGFAAHDVALTLDRSAFNGTLTLTRAVGLDHARFFADLTSEALDLEALPEWRDAAESAQSLDVSLSLSARAIRLAHTDVGTVDAGHIALQLNKTGSTVTLDRLFLADIGGATADLTGRSDGRTAHIQGRFDARKLRDLAGLIQKLAPSTAADLLVGQADLLSPALLQINADAAIGPDGAIRPTLVSVVGTAAGTKLAFHLGPDPGLPQLRDVAPATVTASLLLDAAESGALLRQIGLPTTPTTAIGRAHIEANGRQNASGAIDGSLTGSLADTAVTFQGRRSTTGEASGHLAVRGPNLVPIIRAVTLANPENGAVWPAEAGADLRWADGRLSASNLTGQFAGSRFGGQMALIASPSNPDGSEGGPPVLTGTVSADRLPLPVLASLALGPLPAAKAGALWPDTPFGPALLRLPRAEMALSVASLPWNETVGFRDAKLTLRLAPGVVTLADITASLDGGRAGGTLTLRRDANTASLAGHVEWSDLTLASPGLGGRTRGTLELAGTGASVQAMMAGLAGSGSFGIADGRLPRFDPGAIARVVSKTDAATSSFDAQQITQDLTGELERGALPLGTVMVPVIVASGIVRSDPIKVDGPVLASETTASLDLRSASLSLRTVATERTLPKDWTGSAPQITVSWKGAFANPAREIDANALVNGVAGRAISRDQARIEAYQDDIRERAFFARRLKAIEAEQQAAAEKAKAENEADRQKLNDLAKPSADSPAPKPASARSPNDGPKAAPTAPPRPPVRPPRPVTDNKASPLGILPPALPAEPNLTGRY